MAPNIPPPPPQRIGKYELEQFLGGGMSAVYRARDTLINRPVALKLLKEAYRPEDPTAQRFVLEAQIAGNLTHENVIRTYDFGFDPDGRPYMVLEFVAGDDLSQTIKGGRAGDLANRARIAWELAGALEYIHPRNVIHRDLKPANVMLAGGPTGTVKLMDFGISRTEGVALTMAGMTMGTPGYMAPEQIRGEDVTKSVDIYAYGVLLWELFTSSRAFAGDTLDRVFYMVLNEPLDLAKLQAAGVPAELARQIGQCASKQKGERPPDLRQIRGELERLMKAGGRVPDPASLLPTLEMPARVEAKPSPMMTPAKPAAEPAAGAQRRNLMLGAGGIGLALVIAGVAWMSSAGAGSGAVKSVEPNAATKLAPELTTTTGTMLLVPEGAFLSGEGKQPLTQPAFYIDKTEVTNGAYGEYVRATGAAPPAGFASAQPDRPVVSVTFDEATKFARWAGKRLPSKQEWEKSARGLDGRTFPWGETPETSRANAGLGQTGSLAAVLSFASGSSVFGALQMVGNAWEWVDETGTPSAQNVASLSGQLQPAPAAEERWMEIRGGSYVEKLDPKVLWDRALVPARYSNRLIGFRCAKTALAQE